MTRTGRRRWAPWPTSSIRLRLLGGLAALLVVGTLATSTTSGYFLDGFLEQNAQTTLTLNAGKYRDLLAGGPQTINGDQISVLWGAPVGIVAVGADDRELFSTKTARIATRDVIDTADRTPTGRIGQRDDSEMSNSLIAVRVPSPQLTVAWTDGHPDARPTALILFIDTSMDDLSVDSLVRRQLMVIGCSLAALLALAVLVLRLGMKPLAQMATTAHAIAAGSRQERLTIRGGGGEADQLAVAVNDAFDAQARAEATIRTFAADASHELRTPLATISGWLDLYHQGGLKESGLETALEQIDIEAGRMRLLVEELGLLARLDAGRELENELVDLTALGEGVVNDAQIIYPQRNVAFLAAGPAHVLGDASRLSQVLRNLVGNAVQHTPSDTAVRVEVFVVKDLVQARVVDNGPGIAAADVPRVFERFWRAEASRSRAYGGSGLGLAIVEAITHAHHGQVEVESVVGTGTTVTLSLRSHVLEAVPGVARSGEDG